MLPIFLSVIVYMIKICCDWYKRLLYTIYYIMESNIAALNAILFMNGSSPVLAPVSKAALFGLYRNQVRTLLYWNLFIRQFIIITA